MRVSVIIPTFNRARLLPRAVQSVLAQNWRPLEVVIVDDGSTDDTPGAIREIADHAVEADAQFKAVSQSNGGDASARNAGIDVSTGEWIAFLDDDDTRAPASLSAQMNAVGDAGVVCGLVAQGERMKPASAERLLRGDCAGAFLRGEQSAAITSLIVRREIVGKVGKFDTSLPVGSDMEWIARLAHCADFAAFPEVVADYNFTEEALSRFKGLNELIERDSYDLRVVDLIRERCQSMARFDAEAWSSFAARTYDRCVKHLLYAGRVDEAEALLEAGLATGADADRLKQTARKLRKAKLLALVGKRLKHPKFDDPADVRG